MVSEDVKTASLQPPKPFYGVGRFDARAPAPERWTGALGANLLGAKVSLTGPRFRARLEVKGRNEIEADKKSDFARAAALDLLLPAGAQRFDHLVAP